jgi:hypothetical protein
MMSQTSKRELLAEIRPRYTLGNRSAKQRILDELVVITGYHRKYAIQLLNHPPKRRTRQRRASQPRYGGTVRAALEKVWRTANCICCKRLVPVLAEFVEALERHPSSDWMPRCAGSCWASARLRPTGCSNEPGRACGRMA